MIFAALRGLDDARDRHAKTHGLMSSFIPLSEALYWITVLDEGFRSSSYEAARRGHVDGAVMPGLRYARNFHVHELITSLESQGGLTIPFSLPMSINTYVAWRKFDDLTTPSKSSKHTPAQQRSYAADVAPQAPRRTLERASVWLHYWHEQWTGTVIRD